MKKITLALAGNPNCGKTTLFNGLTGLHHHVGNWPGKTVSVEREEGEIIYNDCSFSIVDLPGIYSLSSRTLEEDLAAEYLLLEKPDVVVNIVDASHLEKNLYLTLQLLEIGAPTIVALNMNKFAAKDGIVVDEKILSEELGVPVIKIETVNKNDRTRLLDEVIHTYHHTNLAVPIEHSHTHNKTKVSYLHEHILEQHPEKVTHTHVKTIHYYDEELEFHIEDLCEEGMTRWEALQTLIHQTQNEDSHTFITRRHLESEYQGQCLTEIIATQKYQHIERILKKAIRKKGAHQKRLTNAIDKILMNRILALPIFLFIIFVIFQLIFFIGNPAKELILTFFNQCGVILSSVLSGTPDWVNSLISNGIINGLGTVISFLPNILIMFLMLAILENSGYLARVAVIMDVFMKKIGLHGKSFIPMILGFGCSVPAIMASRTLENERIKKLTMLLTPFMSCSARLTVYIIIIGIFFPNHEGLILFILYIIGILIAFLIGFILRKSLFRGDEPSFVIEMPAYHLPRIKDTLLVMWDNAKEFITRAGIIIFPAILFIWLLASVPFGTEYASMDSLLGKTGSFIAPIFEPLGFGYSVIAVAIIMGLFAKEAIIGTIASICGANGVDIITSLQSALSPLSAFTLMVFILLYTPCISALITLKKESHSWLFTICAALMYFGIAWIISFIIYQVGVTFGF